MRRIIIAFLMLCWSVALHADYLEVRSAATLKTTPNSNGSVVVKPEVGAILKLVKEEQTNGYYFALTKDGSSGWIYRTLVRRFRGEPEGFGGPTPSAEPVSTIHTVHCLVSCPAGAPNTD